MNNNTEKISNAKKLTDQIFNNVIKRIPIQKENNQSENLLQSKEIENLSLPQHESKLIKDSKSEIQSQKYLVENFLNEIFSNKINNVVTLIELNHKEKISKDPTSEMEINSKIKENIIFKNKNSNLKDYEQIYSEDIVDLKFVIKKELCANEKISLKRQQTEQMKNNFADESSISEASVNISGEIKSVYSAGTVEDLEIKVINRKQQVNSSKNILVELEENSRVINEESKSSTIVHVHAQNNKSIYNEDVDRRNSIFAEENKENNILSNDLLKLGGDKPTVEENSNENIEIAERKDSPVNNLRKNSLIYKINYAENKIKEELQKIQKFNLESEKKKDMEEFKEKANFDKVGVSPLKPKLIVKKIKIVHKGIPTAAAVTNQLNEINILKEKLKVTKLRTTFLNKEAVIKPEKINQEPRVLNAPYIKENLTKQHKDIYKAGNTGKNDQNEPFDNFKLEEDLNTNKKTTALIQTRNKTAKEYSKSIYNEHHMHPSPIKKKEKRGLSTRQKKLQEDDRKTLMLMNDPSNPYSANWANRILLKQYKVGITVGRFYNGVPIMKLKKKDKKLLPNLLMKKSADNFDIVRESAEIEFNTNRKNFYRARKDIEEDPNEYEMRESMEGNGDIQFPIIYNYLK